MLNLRSHIASRLNDTQFANLYTFLIVARYLSFARAADELCLTPSAVSHRIGRLEQALSVRLFKRMTRQICLTAEGERIFEILQHAVGELSEALQQNSQAEISGAITLYVQPSVAQCWLVPRLTDFAKRYPLASLNIEVGNDNADFRKRNLDLALYYANGEFPGLISHKLMEEKMAPVCSPEYARIHGLLNNQDNLRECTLLHDSRAWDNAAFDAEWTLWAREHGGATKLSDRYMTFDRSDLCMIAAMNHAGIAIGRYRLVQKWLDLGELILPFGGFTKYGHYDYYLVHPPHDSIPRRIQVLIDWLHECAGQP